jgi:hypothetical protein
MGKIYPGRALTGSISCCEVLFLWIEDRLKNPVFDIDLILILQNQGAEQYSDALAAMVLTSDDVAEKYQLSLRPHIATDAAGHDKFQG